jgi:replicative DNA helicase
MSPSELMLPGGLPAPQLLTDQILELGAALCARSKYLFTPRPIGIPWLEETFSGGYHPEDLYLLLGKQNVGKTIFVLQTARANALWAKANEYPLAALVFSYEHSAWSLFTRLLCMESWVLSPAKALHYAQINAAVTRVKEGFGDEIGSADDLWAAPRPGHSLFLDRFFAELPPIGLQAYRAIMSYASHMVIYEASRVHTTLEQIEAIWKHLQAEYGLCGFLIIDYLQTLPAPEKLWTSKLTNVRDVVVGTNLQLLKDFAKRAQVPVLAVSSVERDALSDPSPVHIEDADGPEVVPFTVDGAIVLNREQVPACSRYDPPPKRYVRISVEKNRNHGPSEVEYRHQIQGGSFLISPQGSKVALAESFQAERIQEKNA